jgi:hypothetical protein
VIKRQGQTWQLVPAGWAKNTVSNSGSANRTWPYGWGHVHNEVPPTTQCCTPPHPILGRHTLRLASSSGSAATTAAFGAAVPFSAAAANLSARRFSFSSPDSTPKRSARFCFFACSRSGTGRSNLSARFSFFSLSKSALGCTAQSCQQDRPAGDAQNMMLGSHGKPPLSLSGTDDRLSTAQHRTPEDLNKQRTSPNLSALPLILSASFTTPNLMCPK